jgi:hypothetical protein
MPTEQGLSSVTSFRHVEAIVMLVGFTFRGSVLMKGKSNARILAGPVDRVGVGGHDVADAESEFGKPHRNTQTSNFAIVARLACPASDDRPFK